MDIIFNGPYSIKNRSLYEIFCLAQAWWDRAEEGDTFVFSSADIKTPCSKISKYPCVLFEYAEYGDMIYLYRTGCYKNYRGAMRAFSRFVAELRNIDSRTDLMMKYSDCQYLIWDTENGSILLYRNYYGHNTRLWCDNLRIGGE